MKKHDFFKKLPIHLTLCFLLFGLAIFVNSCHKDQTTVVSPTVLTQSDLDELKQIYKVGTTGIPITANFLAGTNTTTANSGTGITNNAKNLINNTDVRWEKYVINDRADNSRVVEFDMQPDIRSLILKNLSQGDSIYYHNKTAAVFIKFSNGTRLNFLMKVIEDYSQTHQSVISNMHYRQIPATFSGVVFYYSLNNKFINGVRYRKGRVTGTIHTATGDSPQILVNASTKSIINKTIKTNVLADPDPDECGWFDVYSMYCQFDGSGNVLFCDKDILYYYYVDCQDSEGGGPGDGVTGDPGSGGGGSSPTPPPAPKILDSLKKDFPCAAKLIIDSLLNIPNYNNLVSIFMNNKPDLIWKDASLPWNTPNPDPTLTTTGYELASTTNNGRSSTITLNSNMLRSSSKLLIVAETIHETFHAYINYNIVTSTGGFSPPAQFNSNGTWLYSLDTWISVAGLPRNYSDHYQMLSDYFNQSVSILAQWDNNAHTTKEYAEAMLYGLDNGTDGSADQQALLKTEFNNLMTQYGITAADLSAFNTVNINAPSLSKLPNNSNCTVINED